MNKKPYVPPAFKLETDAQTFITNSLAAELALQNGIALIKQCAMRDAMQQLEKALAYLKAQKFTSIDTEKPSF